MIKLPFHSKSAGRPNIHDPFFQNSQKEDVFWDTLGIFKILQKLCLNFCNSGVTMVLRTLENLENLEITWDFISWPGNPGNPGNNLGFCQLSHKKNYEHNFPFFFNRKSLSSLPNLPLNITLGLIFSSYNVDILIISY